MSIRYKGGILSATPPTLVAGAGASGAWTLEQQMQATAAGNWPVNGPFYIEDVFSTYLYTGTSAVRSINNGIDLSGNGGLVWTKNRNAITDHFLVDTARGMTTANSAILFSNQPSGQNTSPDALNAQSTGYGIGSNTLGLGWNLADNKYVSWTFRKQRKFFDCGTYTGTGTTKTVSHNLGAAPGCIFIKKLDSTGFNAGWAVYHRSLTNPSNYYLVLNTTAAETNYGGSFITNVTSTSFDVNGASGFLGYTGSSYVYYAFAHDAGGFGLTGSDNVISCGSYTTDGSANATVTLGYEPQWLLVKPVSIVETWILMDNMRGLPVGSQARSLYPNTSGTESGDLNISLTATGFKVDASGYSSTKYIYIAIRRGPMKTPTVGTSVFAPVTYTGTGGATTITTNIVPSLTVIKDRSVARDNFWTDMLRGPSLQLRSNTTGAEAFDGTVTPNNTGFSLDGSNGFNNGGETFVSWSFLRAPGFFDEVCYTGTGVAGLAVNHNLGVAPEMMIIKRRNTAWAWAVYYGVTNQYLVLNTTAATASDTLWNSSLQTASVFTLGDPPSVNNTGSTYVAYLFATLAGVSKIGSYTGTGALQTVNCGFTTGARFVLIKRTNSTGGWYVWDSARGISSGNDPYLLWNSDVVEVAGTNYVDTTSVGFQVTAAAPAELNAVGGTYIFLAIA